VPVPGVAVGGWGVPGVSVGLGAPGVIPATAAEVGVPGVTSIACTVTMVGVPTGVRM
jgi:hypothetical protein